jgi:hypothetical protein
MPYKKNSNAYKQAGDGEDGAASSGHEDNPIMQMVARQMGNHIDKKKFDLYATLLNKYALKFKSLNAMLGASSKFGGNPERTIDKVYTLSGSILESLEDLKSDIEGDKLSEVLSSILTEWSDAYGRAKMNLVYIENFKHGVNNVKTKDLQASIGILQKSLSTLTVSLDAYAGYFNYAGRADDRGVPSVIKQDYSRLLSQLQDEMDAMSLAFYMDFQGPKDGLALRNNMMQGAIVRVADRLVTIVDPYLDTSSPKLAKESARVYNLLHDISISSEAIVKIAGKLKSKDKLLFIVKRDIMKPLSQVIYLLGSGSY